MTPPRASAASPVTAAQPPDRNRHPARRGRTSGVEPGFERARRLSHGLAMHFISTVEQVRNTDDLVAAMAAITARLCFHYFSVTHHVDIIAASGIAIRAHDYGFGSFDALEEVILAGLQAGAFDRPALRKVLEEIDASVAKDDVREAIAKPWAIFRDGLGDDADEFLDAVAASIERHGEAVSPVEAFDSLRFMRELGRPEEAARLLPIYVVAQRSNRP